MRFKTLSFFLFLSCASNEKLLEYPIQVKKYKDDDVSVQTAVNLAKSSYLKGCSDKAKLAGQKNFFSECLKKANYFIKNDLVFILDQKE